MTYASSVDILSNTVKVLPYRARIQVALVEFENLHECFGNVGTVQDFDHTYLDTMQDGWWNQSFPYPLWMYPHTELSSPTTLATFEYSELPDNVFDTSTTSCIEEGWGHAVKLWVEYDLDSAGKHVISTGSDSIHFKQIVRFFQKPYYVQSKTMLESVIRFNATEGDIEFDFNLI